MELETIEKKFEVGLRCEANKKVNTSAGHAALAELPRATYALVVPNDLGFVVAACTYSWRLIRES